VAGVSSEDLDLLRERCAVLTERFRTLDFALPAGPIHGDAHTGNLLTDHGEVVLLDFEAVAVGPREWDLMPTAIAYERFGLAGERYREFADVYGFDVRTWAGYPVLRAIRELTMTTWLMQNVGEDPAIAAEFALRVDSIRKGDLSRAWTPF
jgi:thiamine kinase-like enzyme